MPCEINVFLYDDTHNIYNFQLLSASTKIQILWYAEVWLTIVQRLKGI